MGLSLPPIRQDLDAAEQDLREHGAARIESPLSDDQLNALRARLIDQARGEDAAGIAFRETGRKVQTGRSGPNQRVMHLINKGQVFRDLALHPTVLALVRRVLGEEALLYSHTANIACLGGEAQALHGDQGFAPPEIGMPLLVNCLWMLDDFTDANGATRVVPGSHLYGRWPDPDTAVETIPATGPRGTLMLFDGRLWHGTGANTTDTPRHGILATYCRPFMRQQENWTLSVAPEVLETASDELRSLLGFRSWRSMGSIDGSDSGVLHARPTIYSRELHATV